MAGSNYSPSSRRSSLDSLEDNLPYPTPLPRSDFLSPFFEPSAYLSNLRHRHQTLEDLRDELRSRKQAINQELLELVNANYNEFLALSSNFEGGEARLDAVRIGLLAFRSEIEALKGRVMEKQKELECLTQKRRRARNQIELCRCLLGIETRTAELTERLGLRNRRVQGFRDGELDSDARLTDDAVDGVDAADWYHDSSGSWLLRLERDIQDYLMVEQLSAEVGRQLPLVLPQRRKTRGIKETLHHQLSVALKQAKAPRGTMNVQAIDVIRLYKQLAEAETATEQPGNPLSTM